MSKMLEIKTTKTGIKIIHKGDPKWMIQDGYVFAPRAGFEFGEGCPLEYKRIALEMIQTGWLKPIAYMKDSEMMWETLSD